MDVREKLVELFYENNVRCDQKIEGLADDVIDIIDHGVTVQEWISVKDRLPNLDEAVLVLAEYLHIKTNYYEAWSLFKCESGETIWVDKYGNGHNLTEVTYWMPLPSAPKGETIY